MRNAPHLTGVGIFAWTTPDAQELIGPALHESKGSRFDSSNEKDNSSENFFGGYFIVR
jgi:hypothetical protein